jgi:hypothetical protein
MKKVVFYSWICKRLSSRSVICKNVFGCDVCLNDIGFGVWSGFVWFGGEKGNESGVLL